jgi:RNA polymerase sigma-70 factor (ECF subfamily)
MAIDPDDIPGISAAIASGSTEAFATFYEGWFDHCHERVRMMTGFDEATSLDVVQDTMLKVSGSMPRFENRRQLSAWLDRVMINVARDRIRSEKRRKQREANRRRHQAEDTLHEDIDALDARLASLEQEQRTLLQARFSLGWTLQRIADALGLGTGAVDGRIRRSLEQLREELTPSETDQER